MHNGYEITIEAFLELQQQNLAKNLTQEQIQTQGFVTLVHTFDLLKRMNEAEPSIIASEGERIAGYCLSMTEAFKEEVPDLKPMYAEINAMQAASTLNKGKHITIGQICVSAAYRGQGVFDGLYEAFKKQFSHHYAFVVTEISSRNKRSLQAHKRIGFTVIYTHPGEEWLTVVWNWRKDKDKR